MKRIRSVKKSLVSSSGSRMQAYPNPADEILTVSLSPETSQGTTAPVSSSTSRNAAPVTKSSQKSSFTVRLYNPLQEVVYEANSTQAELIIPVKHLPAGFYILHVTEKGNTIRKHIIINH
jgi:hypothetical protein